MTETMTDAERNAAVGGHPVDSCDMCGVQHFPPSSYYDENGMFKVVEHVSGLLDEAMEMVAGAIRILEGTGRSAKKIGVEPCGMYMEYDLTEILANLADLGYLAANGQLFPLDYELPKPPPQAGEEFPDDLPF